MAKKAIKFLLVDEDRERLKKIARSGLLPHRSVTRTTILLLLESGLSPKEGRGRDGSFLPPLPRPDD